MTRFNPLSKYLRSPLSPADISETREVVKRFLNKAPLEESILLLDGPGLGCSRLSLVVPLIGMERLKRLKAIHAFSAASYTVFFYYGFKEGSLIYDSAKLDLWNRENQQRHGIDKPLLSILTGIGKKMMGRKYIYPGDRLEDPMRVTLSREYCERKVRELPPNLHFWTFNENDQKLVDIHASGELADLTTGQVMRAVASVPQIYEPFHYQGKIYSDALFAPGVKNLYRSLRADSPNCLFAHMSKSGEKDNTIFWKAHHHGSGVERVVVDFLYFIGGLENREFTDGLRRMFEIEPV
jgi:hypothetical protein